MKSNIKKKSMNNIVIIQSCDLWLRCHLLLFILSHLLDVFSPLIFSISDAGVSPHPISSIYISFFFQLLHSFPLSFPCHHQGSHHFFFPIISSLLTLSSSTPFQPSFLFLIRPRPFSPPRALLPFICLSGTSCPSSSSSSFS